MPVFFLKQGSRKLQDALPGFIEPLIAGQSIGSELGGRFDRGITELGRVFVFFYFEPRRMLPSADSFLCLFEWIIYDQPTVW